MAGDKTKQQGKVVKPRSAYAVGFMICRALSGHAQAHRVLHGNEIRVIHGLTLPVLMEVLRDLARTIPDWQPPREATAIRRACNDLRTRGLIGRSAIPQDQLPPFALYYLHTPSGSAGPAPTGPVPT